MTISLRRGTRAGRLSAIALGLAAASVLAACSSSGGSTDAGDGDGGDVALTVWGWGSPVEGMQAAVPAFEEANPGVTVDVQDVGNPAIWDKITTGMAAGGQGLPDVMDIGADYMSNYLETFPGGFANLSELGADEFEADFPTGLWGGAQDAAGDQYGIPFEVNTNLVFYRTDLFEQAGVDMDAIETWDQLVEAGIAIKEATGADLMAIDKAATQADSANAWQMLARLQSTFFFDGDGAIAFNDPAGVRALELLKEANDAGILADVPMSQGRTAQLKGQTPVAIVPEASWMVGSFPNDAPEMQGKWAVRTPPAMEEGGLTAASAGGTYLAVAGTSEHQQEAYDFVTFAMASLEGQQLVYEGGGLFPSYAPMWEDAAFTEPNEYFGFDTNALVIDALSQDTPPDYYTKDYARGLKAYDDAQTRVLVSGADPQEALDEAAELLSQQTGREIAAG